MSLKRTFVLSDKLYFENKYFVEKVVLSTILFHPHLKKSFNIEFHLCLLKEDRTEKENTLKFLKEKYWNNEIERKRKIRNPNNEFADFGEKFQKQMLERLYLNYEYKIVDCDLTNEIRKYCPNLNGQSSYIYQKAYSDEKELPFFYSTMANINLYQDLDISKENKEKIQSFNN